MAPRHRRSAGGRRTRRAPKDLRTAVGGIVLVAAVRTVDALWHRIAGRPTPVETRTEDDAITATDARVVRDRMLYATLLGAALRVARRAGLPEDPRTIRRGTGTTGGVAHATRTDEKSPA